MDFESLSLFHIGIPLFLLFGAMHFGICFVRRDGLRKALRVIAFLPIAAAAVCAALAGLLFGDGFFDFDTGAFGALLIGIPALFALGGSGIGWLIGHAVKKKRQSAVASTTF